MADFQNMRSKTVVRGDTSIDAGLRSYMLRVYNMMAMGLLVAALTAVGVHNLAVSSQEFSNFLHSMRIVLLFAPLAIVLFLSFKINDLSAATARTLFFAYTVFSGLWLSSIFIAFRLDSIAQVFFITAGSFGALSLYGYTTRRDLRPLGSFMIIGLVGLILAMIVHIFFMPNAPAMSFGISVIGVIIFAGLTAYDTQAIKEMYYEGDDHDTMGRKVAMGALTLYLDFINMFRFLLNLIGSRD